MRREPDTRPCECDALDEWAVWASEHLPGPPTAYAHKAGVEWTEFENAENAQEACEEAVDIIMCLAAFVWAHGRSPAAMVGHKHFVNSQRTWARRADGTYQHIEPGR